MEKCVKRMIEEHAQLAVRIAELNTYVYSEASDKDDKVEFANKCIQLSSMKKYEEALRARLENQGIQFTEDGEYFEKVANIEVISTSINKPEEITDDGTKCNSTDK